MVKLQGEGVSAGIAFGTIRFSRNSQPQAEKKILQNWQQEIDLYENARQKALAELLRLHTETTKKLGEENAQVFEIHRMMLEDPDFNDCILEKIEKEHFSAEYAVETAAEQFSLLFSSMEDEYMQGRAGDVRDISYRLLRILQGKDVIESMPTGNDGEKIILADDDFTPSETARLDTSHICALLTREGSRNSHTAIFARTMGIPAVIGLGQELDPLLEGKSCIVDGESGQVFMDPDSQTRSSLLSKQEKEKEQKQHLEAYRGRKSITKDGRKIHICANIGGIRDLDSALENDAEGIGLFRSEFLYLERQAPPSEEEQFQVYRKAAEALKGKQVIIRTLDIGADKQAEYFHLPKEENPALGMRAIRLCFQRPDIFRTQLRALYRASAFGNIAIMFPMIISLEEVRQIRKITLDVQKELAAENLPFRKETPLGIMIETPAAAIISDCLAEEVDFFSIGTNDLIQYTLAADRQNRAVSALCNPYHEAVMRLIRLTCQNAHRKGKWVGICGELASDTSLTGEFLAMGVDELSVSPAAVLSVRAVVCETGSL